MAKIIIDTKKETEDLGDLFGIFFEDINHAADGGIYGELVQNRSFEFDPIDRHDYHSMTAWEQVCPNDSRIAVSVQCDRPIHKNNPHYLVLDVFETVGGAGIRNLGFNSGIPYKEGAEYRFSCFMACDGRPVKVLVTLESEEGTVYGSSEFEVTGKEWTQFSDIITCIQTDTNGRLVIKVLTEGRLYLDMVSLFPTRTYKGRENGMREDLARLLEELKPKFMRFPGGCLVHDGSLNSEDRDSMYRWKNTIGELHERPSRRSNWGYNQTLGLGYYEYFLLCEDLKAKPLPVLPAGYDPHHQRMVPFDQLDEWVQEALDLIEFANGDETTEWGRKRMELGHKEPFYLEYIAIGNEEVGDGFFERYPYFHKAIKEKYPDIKVINSSGPFSGGGEYEKGWKSARDNQSDLVDEHYYSAPEWFLANHHHYDNFKKEDPKVFLGEYGTWGSTWYNALVEASYMIGLERNAHAVALACYAPLFCNADYINWQPDMIWFNNHEAYGTANYYVQKLFMNHQGDVLVDVSLEDMPENVEVASTTGKDIFLPHVPHTTSSYFDIEVIDEDTKEVKRFDECTISSVEEEVYLTSMEANNYTVRMKAKKLSGVRGFAIQFDRADNGNKRTWEYGGWQNQDSIVSEDTNGRGTVLTHEFRIVNLNQVYDLELQVKGNEITTFIDGEQVNQTNKIEVVLEPLYVSSSKDKTTGDIIVKVVNVQEKPLNTTIDFKNHDKQSLRGTVYQMAGYGLEDKNSFEQPQLVSPKEWEITIEGNCVNYEFPAHSLTVFKVS